MNDATWPCYGGLAVATHARRSGAGVRILDRRADPAEPTLVEALREADLVLIGMTTADVPDAYHVADLARRLGLPVVVGGVHPTAVGPGGEGLPEGTSLLTGDGMSVVADVIRDWRSGALRPLYQGDLDPAGIVRRLDELAPDRSLLPAGHAYLDSIVTEMGCPNSCTFCFDANTGTHRRDPRRVVEELAGIGPGSVTAVFDDNILGADPAGAGTLAGAILRDELDLRWFGNTDITCLLHLDVLEALRQAGMASIYIGFESIFADSLRLAGKINLVRRVYASGVLGSAPRTIEDGHIRDLYATAVERLHGLGLTVYCGLICGWPHEGPERIEALRSFAERVPDMPWLSLATPYPGTALERHLRRSGVPLRPFQSGAYDTNRFAFGHPTHPPAEFYAELEAFFGYLGSPAVIERKRARLAGERFAPWAVESVGNDLRSLRERSQRLYRALLGEDLPSPDRPPFGSGAA